MQSRYSRYVGLGLVAWLSLTVGWAEPMPWLLVDTRAETLTVMTGTKPLEVFTNLAFGTAGVGIKRREGDGKTPKGVFRVGWINEDSEFDLFFGLDYPNLEYAERARREKIIDDWTFLRIRMALRNGLTPPQDTPLGGAIGIHGIGQGDPGIHANFNWTEGCIALDNRQIRRLARWVTIGTRVEIR